MIYPSADTIEDRVGSRYSLVVLAAKRAKQIKEGSPILIETESTNPLTIAMEEIAAGKVTIQEPVEAAHATADDGERLIPALAIDKGKPVDKRPLAIDDFDPMLGGPGTAEE